MQEEEHILFEKYLSGDLNGSELEAFEQRLGSDVEFKNGFTLYRDMQGYLEDKIRHADALKNIRSVSSERRVSIEKGTKEKAKQKPRWFYYVSTAATVLILCGILSYFIKPEKAVTYADVYMEPEWPIKRSGDGNKFLRGAAVQVIDENYGGAVNVLKKSNLDADERDYWIAEVFAKQGEADSVLYYLPDAFNTNERRDRQNYLKVIVLYKLNRQEELNKFISTVPENTRKEYLSIIKSLSPN